MSEFNSMVLYPQDSLVKMLVSHKLNFEPSAKYAYSNSNFYLLTLLAEKISGMKFEDVLKERILVPASMANSGKEHNDMILLNRASPYIHAGTGFMNGQYIQMENVGAGLYSTLNDMLNWSLFMQKQVSTDNFLKETLKPFHFANGATSIYSSGWCLLPDKIMHGGHINGFANYFSIDTVNHYTVIILSNDDFKELYVTGETISSILQGENNTLNWLTQKTSSQLLNDYIGAYILGSDTIINKNENGVLVAYFKGNSLPWTPFLKDEYFSEYFEGNILFERNKKGEVYGVKSFENYNWIEWKKIK